jgi:glucose/arabinose dehydrogenase
LVDETVLFTAEPWLPTAHHFGCRVQLDGKGHVFFTIGDRGERNLAQRLDVDPGKVHRIREDGSIPPDNPFVKTAGARPSIWSYGHRNPQGLAFRPGTQELWATEHGPRGGDEVNEIRPGLNYGWPIVTYGREYHGPKIGEGTEKEGMEPPRLQWTPSIAPSGLIFYTGNAFPAWRGQLFAGAMALTHLNRLEIAADGSVVEKERLFDELGWRVRDVEQGPQGHLYLLVDNGWLLRVRPAE